MKSKIRSDSLQMTITKEGLRPSQSLWSRAMSRLRRDRPTLAAMVAIVFLASLAVLAPIIGDVLGVDPYAQDLRKKYLEVGAPGHPLGTDELGRDHLSRLLYGGQISLGIAFAAAILSLCIGVAVGAFAGFYGGIVDDFILWFITTLTSIPGLFLLIIITAVLSPSPPAMVLVFAIIGWTGTTRLVRAETYSLKQREYVIAARAMGASNLRLMFVHIVPNIFSLLIIGLSQAMVGLILAESALSFIGFGIQAPIPTWGNMLSGAFGYMRRAPHLLFLPGMLISVTVFCFYLIGDGLRDAFDPKIAD